MNPSVSDAIEFAKKSRSDCTNLVTFVVLQETGMLDAYMGKTEGPLTPDMIREMEGHRPFSVTDPRDRWEWCANYLNETLRDPHKLCPCCNVTRDGEHMDHLPTPNPQQA